MNIYVVLAGGFWQMSSKPEMGGYQVDKEAKDEKATVDYIVRVEGLPKSFFQPNEIIRKFRYYCKLCKRWVKEVEVEHNTGCIILKDHEVEMQYRDVPVWESSAIDVYAPDRHNWVKPCFRIFVNNEKGMAKWMDIWRYIDRTLPVTVRRADFMPAAVGDKVQWTIQPEEVPVIKLPYDEKSDPDPDVPLMSTEWIKLEMKKSVPDGGPGAAGDDTVLCQICQQPVKGNRGLFAHMLQAHKINIAKESEEKKENNE